MYRYAHLNQDNQVIGVYDFDIPMTVPEYKLTQFAQIGQVYDDASDSFIDPPVVLQPKTEPTIELNNVAVSSTNAALNGNIWWIPKGETFTFTADAEGLPDGELMVMVERVVNATQPVDDLRFIASIKNGKITMNGIFEQSGNYLVTETRLNEGLERINAPFRLSLPRIEFDAYVPAKASSTLSSTITATGLTDKAKQLASKLTGQSSV